MGIMKIEADLIEIQDKRIVLQAVDDINLNHLNLIANGEPVTTNLTIHDNRGITGDQNRLSYALMGDIAKWSYDEPEYIKDVLKFYYKGKTGEEFSHAAATREEAKNWIEFLIEFVLKNDVPLPKRYSYLTQNTWFFYCCLKYRRCCVCGRHADIAHVETVGSGRNRRSVNHATHHFMALCREHHIMQHTLGINEFMTRMHVIPVRLKEETIIRLGLMSVKQIRELKEHTHD